MTADNSLVGDGFEMMVAWLLGLPLPPLPVVPGRVHTLPDDDQGATP